jgi:hypothetical protein
MAHQKFDKAPRLLFNVRVVMKTTFVNKYRCTRRAMAGWPFVSARPVSSASWERNSKTKFFLKPAIAKAVAGFLFLATNKQPKEKVTV